MPQGSHQPKIAMIRSRFFFPAASRGPKLPRGGLNFVEFPLVDTTINRYRTACQEVGRCEGLANVSCVIPSPATYGCFVYPRLAPGNIYEGHNQPLLY